MYGQCSEIDLFKVISSIHMISFDELNVKLIITCIFDYLLYLISFNQSGVCSCHYKI